MAGNTALHDALTTFQESEKAFFLPDDSDYPEKQDGHGDFLPDDSDYPEKHGSRGNSPPVPDLDPSSEALWGIHRYKIVSLLFLFIIGLGCAIGHHVFYIMKDGNPAKHQQWTVRIGNTFAYLLGFSLAAVVGISRDQWLWRTLRTRFLPLRSIDAMFGATSNLFSFLDRDMVLKAKVSTVMAAVKWLFPLATIFTPSTISVVPQSKTTNFSCTVPSLDFNRDRRTLSTDYGNFLTGVEEGDSYFGVTPRAAKIFTVPALSGKITTGGDSKFYESTWEKECITDCVFTYTIQFEGPAVNCTEVDPSILPGVLSNTSYGFSQCDNPQSNSSQSSDTFIPIFLASRLSPTKFWVFQTVPDGPDSRVVCRRRQGYICQASVAQYNITQVLSGHLLQEPIITSVNITSAVMDDYKDFTSLNKGYDSGASWALFDTIFDLLDGRWYLYTLPNTTEDGALVYEHEGTKVSSTSLVGNKDYETVSPLGPAIQEMSYKMAVSLLAYPLLINTVNTTTNCFVTQTQNIYQYKPLILIVIYSIAMGISSFVVVLGIVALKENGVASDTSFSTILLTTRNTRLDETFAGWCLGGSPLPERLGKLRLKFGELPAYAVGGDKLMGYEAYHAGMGVEEEEVLPIREGARYY